MARKDPEVALEEFSLRADENVRQAVIKTLNQVKRIIVGMTRAKLTKRSGALLSSIENAGAQIEQGPSGMVVGKISTMGTAQDARGNPVHKYIGVHFGYEGKATRIFPTHKMYLAVPITGGPAYSGNVPIYTPAMLGNDIHRQGQILITNSGQAIFALVRSVVVKARVDPQKAANQARQSFKENITKALMRTSGARGLGMTSG